MGLCPGTLRYFHIRVMFCSAVGKRVGMFGEGGKGWGEVILRQFSLYDGVEQNQTDNIEPTATII